MIRKDYLMRQFEEFGKFLGIVFALKNDRNWKEIETVIKNSSKKFTSVEINEVEKLNDADLLSHLIETHHLKDDQLKMLGDLLYEKGISLAHQFNESASNNSLKKSLLVFTWLKSNSLEIDFSLDMHFKINSLKQMLAN